MACSTSFIRRYCSLPGPTPIAAPASSSSPAICRRRRSKRASPPSRPPTSPRCRGRDRFSPFPTAIPAKAGIHRATAEATGQWIPAFAGMAVGGGMVAKNFRFPIRAITKEGAVTRQTISVKPVAGALGAEIAGVDLSGPLSDRVIGEIRAALLDHLVIFFHDQHLTAEQQLDFGRRFGQLQVHEFVEAMAGYPEILEVRKEPEETRNFGGGWHTDVSYLERPSLGSVLYAREVPEFGGDTMFANQYRAYETLSDGLKSLLGGMRAVHSARKS